MLLNAFLIVDVFQTQPFSPH